VAYVRTSKSRGKEYRQIVESYREDGKVKQRVLVHMPRFADTPEHAADLCEGYAATERSLEEKYEKKADEAHPRLEWVQQRRRQSGLSPLPSPESDEARARREAERYARQAEKYEKKARTIRELIACGKLQPDAPEAREAREERRKERLARLRQGRR
jgi:hypothetical protein